MAFGLMPAALSASRQFWREVSQSELAAAREQPDAAEARFGRHKPTMEEFLKLFPTSFKKEPREALLSGDQVKAAFLSLGWHRDLYKGMSDKAEADGIIRRVSGEGRGGQILRGLPEILAAYTARREEKGSMMEDVPLKVTAKRRKPPKRRWNANSGNSGAGRERKAPRTNSGNSSPPLGPQHHPDSRICRVLAACRT